MSDKIKEFVEIPQQFVRDGKQVQHIFSVDLQTYLMMLWQFITRCTKPSQTGLLHFVITDMHLMSALYFQSSLLYAGQLRLGSQ
jgi:hypothetical protein